MATVGERLKEERQLRGWSQRDLARESGTTAETISSIETGQHEPRPSTLRKLAEGLGIEVRDFYAEPALPKADAPETGQTASQEEPGLAFDVAYELTRAEIKGLSQAWNRIKESGTAQRMKGNWQGRIEERYAEQWPDPEYRYGRVVYGLRHAVRRVMELEGENGQLREENAMLRDRLQERERAHS